MKGYVEVKENVVNPNDYNRLPIFQVYDPIKKKYIEVAEIDLCMVTRDPNWIYINRLVKAAKVAREITESVINKIINDEIYNNTVTIYFNEIPKNDINKDIIKERICLSFEKLDKSEIKFNNDDDPECEPLYLTVNFDAIRQLIGDSPSAPEIIIEDKKPNFFSWFNQIKEYRKDLTIEEFHVEYLAVGDISEDDIVKNMDRYILNLMNNLDAVGYFEWCCNYGITKPISDIDLIKKLYPLFSKYQCKNMLHYANYINHLYCARYFIEVLKEFSSVANDKILCKLAAYKNYTDINIAPISFKEWVKRDE